jgi:hypothetical protein
MQLGGPVPTWAILRSKGDGTFAVEASGIPFDAALSQAGVTIADPRGPRVFELDGDGAHDVLLPVGGALHVFRNEASHPDVLVTITDGMSPYPDEDAPGYRPSVAIEYGTLVDRSVTSGAPPGAASHENLPYIARHDAANECDYPVRCVVGPRRVVTAYAIDTAAAEPRHFGLRYRDGRWHRLGRGFLGFAERIVDDLDTGAGALEVYDNMTYDPDLRVFPFAGHTVRALGWSYDQKPQEFDFELSFSSVMHQVAVTSGGATYFTLPVFSRQSHEQGTVGLFELAALFGSHEAYAREASFGGADTERLSDSIRAVSDFDLHGNVLAEVTSAGKDLWQQGGAEVVEEVTRDFDADESKWLVAELRTQSHCSTAGGRTMCRSLQRKYDAQGRVTSVAWGSPGDPETQVSVSFSRDAFGNVTKAVAVDAFEGRRASCTSYDLEGVFPYARKNAEGHLSYAKFHPGLGVQVAEVDPNGLATQWAHDRFGRVGKEKRPDGTGTNTTLARKKKEGLFRVEVATTSSGSGTEVAELDPLGRVVRQWSPGVQTAAIPDPPRILREVEYDALGEHVHRILSPVAETAPEDERHYEFLERDASGRVVKHVSPWNATTRTMYEGAKIRVVDPRGGQTVTTLDGLGRPSLIKDAKGGETRYAYGPFGGLLGRGVAGAGAGWGRHHDRA